MFAAAAVLDPREDESQLAVAQPRIRASHVERARQPDRACEPTEHTLGDMKGGLAAMLAGGWSLLAGHEHGVVRDNDLYVLGGDADEIHDDFDRSRRLDDVHRDRAFRGARRFHAGELFEETTEVVVQAATFEEDGGHGSILSPPASS